eukprot:jgi/Mesvir1/22895/Mv19418-RA.1
MNCWGRRVACLQLIIALGFAIAYSQSASLSDVDLGAYTCPCLHREDLTLAFLSHHRDTTTAGAQLLAGARQAGRDRSLYLHDDHFPRDFFRIEEAIDYLQAEIRGGVDGIITTLYNDLLLPVLISANAAGIPIYLVGGVDPDLLQSLQSRESLLSPVRASIRRVGPDEAEATLALAQFLLASGIRNVDCVTTDISDMAWNLRCRVLIRVFEQAGMSGQRHLRAPTPADLQGYVRQMELDHPTLPGREMAIVVMESETYQVIRTHLPTTSKQDATIVVFETSVTAMEDIRWGRRVLVVDTGLYTQGYLAVALAAAERQTGQMVTSDIETEVVFYGAGAAEVNDEVMQRELCRAAGNPVCGDPGVLPVTASGCPCFDRASVKFQVIGWYHRQVAFTYQLWQGMKDAERDLQGSSNWNVHPDLDLGATENEYIAAVNNTALRGIISLDTAYAPMMPGMLPAIQAIARAGKAVCLAYSHTHVMEPTASESLQGTAASINLFDAGPEKDSSSSGSSSGVGSIVPGGSIINAAGGSINSTVPGTAIPDVSSIGGLLGVIAEPAWARTVHESLEIFGAHAAVVTDLLSAGTLVSRLAVQLGARHVLANNALYKLPWAWELMRGVVAGVVGDKYEFPNGTWAWPLTAHGSPSDRTGVWSLFVSPQTNQTVQVMDGEIPIPGSNFLLPLYKRLAYDMPAPDLLMLQTMDTSIGPATLSLLANLSLAQPARPPVKLITHKCSASEFLALLRNGTLPGEDRLLGCVDEQPYLSTYLSATAAALEQQTGERIVGEVRTERLLRYDQLPPNFAARAGCELVGYRDGAKVGTLGTFYPVCESKRGCIRAFSLSQNITPRDYFKCSGQGTCHSLTDDTVDADEHDSTLNHSQGACHCNPGWEGYFCEIAVAEVNSPSLSRGDGRRIKILIAVLLSSLGAACLVALPIIYRMRYFHKHQRAEVVKEFLRKRSPPGMEALITVVITDVEGSTPLWESNPEAMKKALDIHHCLLRSLLPKYHGYESDTEGDSFSLIFHDPVDALGWAMDVQRSLLFPTKLPLITNSQGVQSPLKPRPRRLSIDETTLGDWPMEILASDAAAEVKDPEDGSVIYRGLRVRMGMHIGTPESCTLHPNGRQHYQGLMVEMTKAIANAATSGGQVLMSMAAWQALGINQPSVVCHHMGLHELGEKLPPIHLMQVLPEELLKRAPFAPIKSKQLRPSFFDAPAADCYVKGVQPTVPMVIAFIYVVGAKLLRRCPAYQQAVHLLVEFVQGLLLRYQGYEVEEKDGKFLLAFQSSDMAAHFAEAVQREAMSLDWPEQLLEQDLATEVVKSAGYGRGGDTKGDVMVYRGLRLQIGMCMGVPSDCQPHKATGRAAYFGPMVNRAARIAAAAAHGQSLANRSLYEAAHESTPDLTWKEMGVYYLKGVKESMHLYQISSPALSARLHPRTLKLVRASLSKGPLSRPMMEERERPAIASLLRMKSITSSASDSSVGGNSLRGTGSSHRSTGSSHRSPAGLASSGDELFPLRGVADVLSISSPRYEEMEAEVRAQCKDLSFDDMVALLVSQRMEMLEMLRVSKPESGRGWLDAKLLEST